VKHSSGGDRKQPSTVKIKVVTSGARKGKGGETNEISRMGVPVVPDINRNLEKMLLEGGGITSNQK
jgi:hypothetical protein